jgi:hypothetical protein
VLDEQPFSSVHKIAKRTYIPMTKFNGDWWILLALSWSIFVGLS